MKRFSSLLCGIGLVALQACSAAPQDGSEDLALSENAASPTAYMNITSDGGTWYCAHVFASNPLSVAAANWAVLLDMKGTTVTGNWGANVNQTTGIVTATPSGWSAVAAGATQEVFMFCANATPGGPRAAIKAYNFKMDLFTTCETNSGKDPAKAALAVAMANELGRWEPDQDLVVDKTGWDWKVRLSASAVCLKNNCANTKAILGQQDFTTDQNLFNNVDFGQELQASFQRQADLLGDLSRNNPSKLPISNYKLTQVAGPVNLGYGNCGPHYVFQVDYKSTGKPLSATDATNLMATMCFYGGNACGNGNPYLGYITTNIPGCPSGKQCIAIDPTDGDVSSTSTTTAGSAPTYPFNRVYDPTNSLLGTACITTKGVYGTLQSKCSVLPSTCGYLYCVAM